MKRMSWVLVVAMILVLPSLTAAQGQIGHITGVVTDASGAVLPGATVTAKSDTGTVKTTVSDSTGHFSMDVPPGGYEVTVELSGFTRQVTKGVVTIAQSFNVEAKLEIGKQAETVEVTGSLIPRPTMEAMTPVTTMDVQELSYQGKARLEDLLT